MTLLQRLVTPLWLWTARHVLSLSGTTPKPKRVIAMGGLSQQQILQALEEQEPQSVHQLQQRLPEMKTLKAHLSAMAKTGALTRARKHGGGGMFWYARPATAFHPDEFKASQSTAP